MKSLGGRNSTNYKQLRRKYQESGDTQSLERARALVQGNNRITVADKERLLGYLEGSGVTILPEPQVMLTATPKVPGLDGRKMSKSYGNTIGLREDPDSVAQKMRTDADGPGARAPHRPGRSGEVPGVGPAQDLLGRGRRGSGRSKAAARPASAASTARSRSSTKWWRRSPTMRKRAQEFEDSPELLRNIVSEGAEKAREAARQTLDEVRRAMHLRAD